jgi:hypothetical protein
MDVLFESKRDTHCELFDWVEEDEMMKSYEGEVGLVKIDRNM